MHWMTAAELALGYRKKSFSPVEVTQHLLNRIDALNPKYHAFIEVDHEGALAAARQAEQEIAAGRALGPLHGVPIGIKDIIDIAGQKTTCHSNIMLEHRASEDGEAGGEQQPAKEGTHEGLKKMFSGSGLKTKHQIPVTQN